MSQRKMLARLALGSLAALCIAAPAAATAAPSDPVTAAAQTPQQLDMHASTVQKPGAVVVQDARGESAAAHYGVTAVVTQDARGESAAGGGTTTGGGPVREPQVQGPPTWPVDPAPISPQPAPVATGGGSDDIGLDLPVALLILAGTLALGGGMAAAALKLRGPAHTAH